MKFLCVPCDEPMKLLETRGPDAGSITLVYNCQACGYEFAMLTNAHETQVVSSLGIQVGAEGADRGEGSKCPFTGMVNEMTGEAESAEPVPWTTEARDRLESIPSFLRPMAKTGIEKFAKDRGLAQIDAQVLEQAKDFFGM
jgi:hypothetical protein